jgi:amidohydrolase
LAPCPAWAQTKAIDVEIDRRVGEVQSQVVAWRRDFHEHPELSNRETRTGKIVADYLTSLGLDVTRNVAHTGVVAILKGGLAGPVVALRTDMDALPVAEELDLPFKSTVRSTFNGQDVGVMHACGHDAHMAMMMGVATVLTAMRAQIPGTIKFIFQPAEEGYPIGEDGGAGLMIKEGVLENPHVDAIFGMHVLPFHTGEIQYRPGAIMASSDHFLIVVTGKGTHGALPWGGVDPVVISSQIVLGLQTITSRQEDLTTGPLVITVGRVSGGVRYNIIPDSVVLEGTIRSFDRAVRTDVIARMTRTAESIAQSAGATAKMTLVAGSNPVTYNDPALTARMMPTLAHVAGDKNVSIATPMTIAEDFSLYEEKVPGMFFFLGVTPMDQDATTAARNHSPKFFVDESAMPLGMRAMAHVAMDYLAQGKPAFPK